MVANTFDTLKHDFGVEYSSTVYGMMLAQKDNVPQWSEFDDEYLATQMFTGAAGYSSLPPEREIAFVRDDWRAGFGEDVYDSLDPKRYWSSTGCDLRHKNMAILSWATTALKADKIVNPTGFVAGDWTNEAHAYDNNLTNKANYDTTKESWSSDIELTVASTDNIRAIRFYASGEDAAPRPITKVDIQVYNGSYHAVYTEGVFNENTWYIKPLSAVLDGVTKVKFKFYNADVANNREAYLHDVDFIQEATGAGVPRCWADFGGELYVGIDGYLEKLNSGGTAFEIITTTPPTLFAGNITDLEVFKDGFMYIGQEATQVIENCEDDWTDGTHGTSDLDTTDYKVGSGSIKITGNGVVNGDIIAYETITSLDLSSYTGVKLWIKSSATVAANDLALILSDSADCSTSDDVILLPALAAGVWTRVFARQVDPSANTAIRAVGLEYNANAADTTIHIDDVKAESSYYYMDTGETLTQSTLNVQTCDSFAKLFKTNSSTMWKALEPNQLYSNTDPSNLAAANWSTVYLVGDASYNINQLISQKNSLYMIKGDRPYYMDSTPAVQVLTEETSSIASSTGGTNSISWQGGLYMPYGDASLLEYDASAAFNWIEPSRYCTNLPAFDGQIQALAGDDQYLYPIVDNNGSVEVMATRLESVDGTTRRVWHPYQTQALTGCQSAHISSVSQKRLYIASTLGTESLFYMPLPATYGNIASDTNKAYPTSGTQYFETPKHHLNFKGDVKSFFTVTVELGHSNDDDIYWECWYKIEDGSYADAGDLKGSASTRIATLHFATNTTGRNMRLMFVGNTDLTSTTPILLWYRIGAILYPTRRKLFVAEVRCADKVIDKAGAEMDTTAANITTYLDAARAATWPITIKDPWNATKTVRFLGSRSTPACAISAALKGEEIEKHYWLLMEEVTLS